MCGEGGAIFSKTWRNGPEEPQLSSNLHLDRRGPSFLAHTYLVVVLEALFPFFHALSSRNPRVLWVEQCTDLASGLTQNPPQHPASFLPNVKTQFSSPSQVCIPYSTFYKNIHSCCSNGKCLSYWISGQEWQKDI